MILQEINTIMKKSVYSICWMCTVRCPILVVVENNTLTRVE